MVFLGACIVCQASMLPCFPVAKGMLINLDLHKRLMSCYVIYSAMYFQYSLWFGIIVEKCICICVIPLEGLNYVGKITISWCNMLADSLNVVEAVDTDGPMT